MNASNLLGLAAITYLISMVVYIVFAVSRKNSVGVAASVLCVLGLFLHTSGFILRWKQFADAYDLGFFQSIPITNMYESLIFFVWCIILANLYVEYRFRTRALGVLVTMLAGMAIAFIDVSGVAKDIQPILPALKSNWLLAHASLSFIAYAAFAVSFVAAVLHLAISAEKRTSALYFFWTGTLAVFIFTMLGMMTDIAAKVAAGNREDMSKPFSSLFSRMDGSDVFVIIVCFAAVYALLWLAGLKIRGLILRLGLTDELLEELTYSAVAVGFPVFTIGGLIFGAIWADQAWGHYWSWDPKETWSLITWLIYAVYIHGRYMKGWRGNRVTVIAVLGFLCTMFTYIGVNLLVSGLHSYGSM
jgi:cytochrome c-type biogenesis protein CcsB